MDRHPFLAMPYALDEYLDELPGDYGKVARRLLRAARWTRGEVDGIQLDAGEALMDERSEKLWGGLRLDRNVSLAGRRALVRRVLERLERDGLATRRAAQEFGPKNSPKNGPRNGPSPTVVRFTKFREILWPATREAAQETAQGAAQETAQRGGPILPGSPPDQPGPPEKREARAAPARLSPLPRRDELFAQRCPRTAELLRALDAGGWQAAWPKDNIGRDAVERRVEAIGVPEAARRLLEHVAAERAQGSEPRPWLGWHLDVIGAPSRASGDVRFGTAPDFGEEGEHDLATGKAKPPAWSKLAQAARATVGREGLARDLGLCTGDVVAGELVIAPPDAYVAGRLVELHRLEDFARVAVPGTAVRVAAPPAAAAAGGTA